MLKFIEYIKTKFFTPAAPVNPFLAASPTDYGSYQVVCNGYAEKMSKQYNRTANAIGQAVLHYVDREQKTLDEVINFPLNSPRYSLKHATAQLNKLNKMHEISDSMNSELLRLSSEKTNIG